MRNKYNKKTLFGCIIIFYISLLVKMFQYVILPANYFYDSKAILFYMNGNYIADKSYNFTARLFDIINIFKFDELFEWSIFLAIIFTPILFFYLIKNYKYTLQQYIFIYSSIVLLNIYVFNLSKDIIQFCFFLVIYIIIMNKAINNKMKIFFISIVLIYEAVNFRIYYLIMAILIAIIYYIYITFFKNKHMNKSNLIKFLTIIFVAFFILVLMTKILSPENYRSILTARSGVNSTRVGSIDAATMINDIFDINMDYFNFIINYIINIFRLMIPIELMAKSIKYTPFIIYQIFISINILRLGENLNTNNILIFATIVSFMIISIIFEPDFGSFVRHESALMLFILQMNIVNNNTINKNIIKEKI